MTPATALEVATMPTRGCSHVSSRYYKKRRSAYQCSCPNHCVLPNSRFEVNEDDLLGGVTISRDLQSLSTSQIHLDRNNQ